MRSCRQVPPAEGRDSYRLTIHEDLRTGWLRFQGDRSEELEALDG